MPMLRVRVTFGLWHATHRNSNPDSPVAPCTGNDSPTMNEFKPESFLMTYRPLEPETVHLWKAHWPNSPDEFDWPLDWLSEDERTRLNRFRMENKRREFAFGRLWLRGLLGSYLDCAPAEVQFAYTERGRPYLPGEEGPEGLQFNLSHSGPRAICGLVRGHAIGIDIERAAGVEPRDGIARRFFTPNEHQAIHNLPEPLQAGAFFRCWTSKEAFLKARSLGLAGHLHSFEVEPDPRCPPALLNVHGDPREAGEWSLRAIEAGEGYDAVCAVRGRTLAWHEFEWPIRSG